MRKAPARPPSPDVLVSAQVEGRALRFGVEVTEYRRTPDDRTLASEWPRIEARIAESVRRRPLPCPVNGLVSFASPPRKSRSLTLADELLGIARLHADRAASGGNIRLTDSHFDDSTPCCQAYVRSLRLCWGEDAVNLWEYNDAFSRSRPAIWEWVSEAVQTKSQKFRCYSREGLDEVWLLLASGGVMGPARSANTIIAPCPFLAQAPPSEITDLCSSSGFDRVFIWNAEPPWAVKLHG